MEVAEEEVYPRVAQLEAAARHPKLNPSHLRPRQRRRIITIATGNHPTSRHRASRKLRPPRLSNPVCLIRKTLEIQSLTSLIAPSLMSVIILSVASPRRLIQSAVAKMVRSPACARTKTCFFPEVRIQSLPPLVDPPPREARPSSPEEAGAAEADPVDKPVGRKLEASEEEALT